MELLGYIKLNKTTSDGSGIYFPKNCTSYLKSIYEEVVDSKGNTHSICTERIDVKYQIRDEDIEVKGTHIEHDFLKLDSFSFQINLHTYYCFIRGWESAYNKVREICRGQWNDVPEIFRHRSWKINDIMEKTGYYPIYELCFTSGNNHALTNYIPDKLFFNFPDRQKALNNAMFGMIDSLNNYKKKALLDFDYINATDRELIEFMNDRFKRRIEYEKQVIPFIH